MLGALEGSGKMKRLAARLAIWLEVVAIVVLANTAAMAAGPSVTLLKDTDLPGFDYQIDKGTTLEKCQAGLRRRQPLPRLHLQQQDQVVLPQGRRRHSPRPSRAPPPAPSTLTPSRRRPRQDPHRRPALPGPGPDRFGQATLPPACRPPTRRRKDLTYADLVAGRRRRRGQARTRRRRGLSYRQALALNHNDPAVWLKLANVMLTQADAVHRSRIRRDMYDLGATASYAALNGFLQIQDSDQAGRAGALGALAHALERREMWRESIAHLPRQPRAGRQRRPAGAARRRRRPARLPHHRQRGRRRSRRPAHLRRRSPIRCRSAAPTSRAMSSSTARRKIAVETEQTPDLHHRRRARQALPHHAPRRPALGRQRDAAQGRRARRLRARPLALRRLCQQRLCAARRPRRRPADHLGQRQDRRRRDLPHRRPLDRDRGAQRHLQGQRSPAIRPRTSPTSTARRSGPARSTSRTAPAQRAWRPPPSRSSDALPNIAAGRLCDHRQGQHGQAARTTGNDLATQWFIVTDLGLTTVSGDDGVHAFVRSLTTAQPVASAKVRLVAVNNEILGEATTDANGEADLRAGPRPRRRRPRAAAARRRDRRPATTPSSMSASPASTSPTAASTAGLAGPARPVRDHRARRLPAGRNGVPDRAAARRACQGRDRPAAHHGGRAAGRRRRRATTCSTTRAPAAISTPCRSIADAMRGAWTIRLYADPKAAALDTVDLPRRGFRARAAGLRRHRARTSAVQPDRAQRDRRRRQIPLRRHRARTSSIEADAVLRPVTTARRPSRATPSAATDDTVRDRPRAARRRRHHRRPAATPPPR